MGIHRAVVRIAVPTLVSGVLSCLVACVVENVTPTPPTTPTAAPTTSTPSVPTTTTPPATTTSSAPAPTPAPADAGSPDATTGPVASADASTPPAAPPDAGAPDKFRACQVDTDCVAVDRVGCCRNGWKEAVAASQASAYGQSFKCPEANPICAMYQVHDTRVAECDGKTHQCTMVKPEEIACGGFIRNRHKCPAGFHCNMAGRNPDVGGTCAADGAADGGPN